MSQRRKLARGVVRRLRHQGVTGGTVRLTDKGVAFEGVRVTRPMRAFGEWSFANSMFDAEASLTAPLVALAPDGYQTLKGLVISIVDRVQSK